MLILLRAGVETSRNVAADVSSFVIDGLQSDSAYRVSVSALTGSREGSPVTLNVRTGNQTKYLFSCSQPEETWKSVFEKSKVKNVFPV